MFEYFLSVLGQNGWKIEFTAEKWVIVLDENGQRGLALLRYPEDYREEAGFAPPKSTYPGIRHWQVIVFCSAGVDSQMLKKVPVGTQFWFWDLAQGNVFPFPAPRDQGMVAWFRQMAEGTYAEPPFGRESGKRTFLGLHSSASPEKQFVPVVTYALIAAILAVFALMTWAGGSTHMAVLVAFGAKVDDLIREGQIWRLLTANFIHIGFFHLAFNLYALWVIGPFAEKLFGHWVYLLIYLLSGIGGNLSSYLFSPAVSAGASAAIFGLLGALLFYSWRRPQLWRSGLGINLIVIIAVNLILGVIQPEIDNFAHLGGLVSGLVLAALWHTFVLPARGTGSDN
ncbi:rhomboid protease GluP [Peptococcaceae bacterium CEB3]|nr:rhomboid protease GluP [Peptococcaceae bacterium CEB3]